MKNSKYKSFRDFQINEELNQQQVNNLCSELENIKDEIKELIYNANRIITRNFPEIEARWKGYPFAHIIMALDSDHSFMGRNTTFAEIIEDIQERYAEGEEE